MAGIFCYGWNFLLCRSSDRKPEKVPQKTEKYRKHRKISKNRRLPQISNLGLVFFSFLLGCNPPTLPCHCLSLLEMTCTYPPHISNLLILFTPCSGGRIEGAFLEVASRRDYPRHFIATRPTQFSDLKQISVTGL